MKSYISRVYKANLILWKRLSLLVWFFDICGLQFKIMREVLLLLYFGFVVWRFALLACCNLWIWFVTLSLVCDLYLVFGIWYLWTVGSLVCICEIELFGCTWDLGLWECLYINFYFPKFDIVKFLCRCSWM